MESISELQKMMAESKFFEAQCIIETILNSSDSSDRMNLIALYFEALEAQSKNLPAHLLIEYSEFLAAEDISEAFEWLGKIDNRKKNFESRILTLKIKAFDKKGQIENLYKALCEYHLWKFENKHPAIPQDIKFISEKYFKHDFLLKLQNLALTLLLKNIPEAEKILQDLILHLDEKTTSKGKEQKYRNIVEILEAIPGISYLEIYKNFCIFSTEGLRDKKDYKKLAEIIIYIDEFKLQVRVLDLLNNLGLTDEAANYALEIKKNTHYSFTYFDKYFPHLKNFFFKAPNKEELQKDSSLNTDISLETSSVTFMESSEEITEVSEEEDHAVQLLKFNNFHNDQLFFLATGFLQSQFYKAAIYASDLILKTTSDEREILKANFLKLTCLLHTGDYRAALDLSLMSLEKAQDQNDVLSFLYCQAEAYQRLQLFGDAKKVLKKILSIDGNYRLTKYKLDALNEI